MEKKHQNTNAKFQNAIAIICGLLLSFLLFIVGLKLTLVTSSIIELVIVMIIGIFLIKKYPQQKKLKAFSWGIMIGSGIILVLSIAAASFIFAALKNIFN